MTRNAVSSSRTSFNAKQSQQQKPSIIRYVVAIPADDELALTTGHVPCCPKPSDSISTRATVMDHKLPDKKKLSLQTLLAKIEDVLQHGSKDDPPAYTLILGAGASFGIVPTAKEMLGIPDPSTKKVHDKSIPLWLAAKKGTAPKDDDEAGRMTCVADFWRDFCDANNSDGACAKIQFDPSHLPLSTSMAEAYQAVFDTACVGGLDTPEKHREYMRHVTMTDGAGQTHLNATHFYLASLLSLQRRSGVLGSSRKPLYTGRREFARTLFTTNFDPLLQTSLQLFQLLYYMTDRPELLPPDALQTDQNPAIHLFYAHGSVHRPYMANTEEQIALLKQQNARDLATYLGSHGVIVLGYSGWDDCLLEALNQCKTFANNLYWLVRRGSPLSESVQKFLASHANAYCVEIEDGGVFMAELHARLCPGAPNTELLYNPIQPLLRQLQCVNLSGIRSGRQTDRTDSGEEAMRGDFPRDVDSIRKAVLAHLQDAERLFDKEAPQRSDIDQRLAQADISYANEDWSAALALYDELLKSGSEFPVETKALALFRRGVCFGRKGDSEKELEDYSAAIGLPGIPTEQLAKVLFNRGVCRGKKGDREKEIEDYSALIGLPGAPTEQVAKALFNRGVRFGQKGDQKSAHEDYTAAIELPGASAEVVARARFNRGVQLSRRGDHVKALEDYAAVIGLSGAPAEMVARARINRGFCLAESGDHDKAIVDFDAIVDLPGAPADIVEEARKQRMQSEHRIAQPSAAESISMKSRGG